MILIVGAKGQLGSALVRLLETQADKYMGVGLSELDITNFDRVVSVISEVRPQLVINCAAYTDVDAAESHKQQSNNVNGQGVKNLAVACEKYGIPLVHISTDFVFDGRACQPYTIHDKPNPISVYGQSKLLGEELLCSHTNKYYLIRTSWMFGQGGNNFLSKLLSLASKNDVINMVNDQTSSPTAATDMAAAILELVKTGAYGLYHYRSHGYCNRFDLATHVLKKAGWNGTLNPVPSSFFANLALRPQYSVLDLYPIDQMGVEFVTWEQATSKWLEENT